MMRSLSASELLDIWEAGQQCSHVRQALLLLDRAFPNQSLETLAQLTIGQRDGYILDLRQGLFGNQLTGLAQCPNCQEINEIELQIDTLRRSPLTPLPKSFCLESARYRIEFRLPNSADLEGLSISSPESMQQTLLEQCLLSIQYEGAACPVESLPSAVIETLLGRMAQVEPQADIQFLLACAECQHHWQMGFDIVAFFWREIDTWARRTLGEVHQLAKAYGWREADVLALSAWRRQYYLELCRS